MRRHVHHLAAVQHEDLVAISQRRQPVRDDHHGPAAWRCAARLALTSASLSGSRALVASSRIRMRGSCDQRAGDGEALALAAREVGRPFLDIGVVAVGHPLDEFLGARQTGGADRRRSSVRPGRPARMLSRIGAAEQEVLLQHHPEVTPHMRQVHFAKIVAVQLHEALVVAGDPLKQARDRRLARAAAPDQAQHRAGRRCRR